MSDVDSGGAELPVGVHALAVGDRAIADLVARISVLGVSDLDLIDRLRLLEDIKSACAAAQVRATACFQSSEDARLAALKVDVQDRRRSIAGQVALARRESPALARRGVAVAGVLAADLPCTLAALESGVISESHANEIAAQTVLLDPAQRRVLDAELAGSLRSLSVSQARRRAKAIAHRLQPETATEMIKNAERRRCVTIRHCDDGMTYLTGYLPTIHGIAVYGELVKAADAARATGDERSRGQVMADSLVHRVTESAAAGAGAAPPPVADIPAVTGVELQLIMTDRALMDGDSEPTLVSGHDSIPAPLARSLLAEAGADVTVWVRRLYTDPASGQLVAMDRDRRLFPAGIRRFLLARDQVCRTPWCGAPIRHADHVQAASSGGATSVGNGQSLCEACNYAKSTPGWSAVAGPDGSIETTTPTGHTYVSDPPVPPTSSPWPMWMPKADIVTQRWSPSERRILDLMVRRPAA